MNEAFTNVIQHPRSIAARRRLAQAWAAAGDARGELLRLELEDLDGNFASGELAARLERKNGKLLAGEIAELVESFTFERGLVGAVSLRAADFMARGMSLFQLAPIIRLGLSDPGEAREVVMSQLLKNVVELDMGGLGLDDDLIIALSRSTHLRELRVLSIQSGSVTSAALRAINYSNNFPNLITVDVTNNPCAADVTTLETGGSYWIAPGGGSWWDKARDGQFYSSDSFNPANFFWPPSFDSYAWTE